MGKHLPHELKQMQSLPLEAKIRMTKERIEAWYESWWRYEIYDKATGCLGVTLKKNRTDFNA